MSLTFPLGASSHEISVSSGAEFPDSQKAWADVTRSTLMLMPSISASVGNRSVHECRAKLVYSTDTFIDQALYAAELISRTRLDDGSYMFIRFDEMYSAKLGPPMASGTTPEDAFIKTSAAYADDQYCIVLVELPMARALNGMAWVCGMCKPDRNVAIVNTFMDDAMTFSVIMHELGHLLCAKHDDSGGVMRPTAIGDGKLGTFSGLAVGQMSSAAREASSRCSEKQWELSTGAAAGGEWTHPEAHTRRRCENCRGDHDHEWHDDDTMAVGWGFFILFFILLVLFLPLCVFYPY